MVTDIKALVSEKVSDLSAMTRLHSCFQSHSSSFSDVMTLHSVLIMPCQILDKSRKLKM